jgi:uncharacterized protein (TIGR02001 family)
MKRTTLGVAAAAAVIVPVSAIAEASSNMGWVSEYIFRGVFQEDSSAYAGIDYATDAGFYLGTWGADVGTGLETDLYFGFGSGEDFDWDDDETAGDFALVFGVKKTFAFGESTRQDVVSR